MMMNNQQIGIQEQGFRSLSSFPFQMPNSKGFSSQQSILLAMEGGSTSQSLRTAALSDITSSHFESGTECCLNFPRCEPHDHSIPFWSQASEMGSSVFSNHTPLEDADSTEKKKVNFRSRDTLQSLVQSSCCSNQNTQSYEENFRYQNSNVPEARHAVEFRQNQPAVNNARDWRQYHNISFQKNFQVENYTFKSQIMDLFPPKFQLENQRIDYSHGLISPTSSNTSDGAAMAKRNRIRWTQELHNQFIECVNRLGGAKKATPKGILKLMNCDGLTIFHIKSHLQKYPVAQYIPEAKEEENTEKTWTSPAPELDPHIGMQMAEALRMQMDVQRNLHEQLECQKNLQSRIEEQAQQLRKMLDRQVETHTNSTKDAN